MNSQTEIQTAKLILENIQMFDDASSFVNEELSPKLFKKIDDTIQAIIKQEQNDWDGEFDFFENKLYFFPNKWKINNDPKNLLAEYYLCSTNNINHWWVTNLFSQKSERMAFFFKLYYGKPEFTFPSKTRTREFRNFISKRMTKIQEFGFEFHSEELTFYLAIPPLDVQQVIEGYENDTLADAMDPIRETLRKLLDAHQYFEQIVEEAKNYSADK